MRFVVRYCNFIICFMFAVRVLIFYIVYIATALPSEKLDCTLFFRNGAVETDLKNKQFVFTCDNTIGKFSVSVCY